MATAKKTSSGRWRVLAYIGKDAHGKRKYKSFTADTKKEAERLAAIYEKAIPSRGSIKLGDAVDAYIDNRDNILSPSTVREYRRIRKTCYADWWDVDIYDLTSEDLQRMVNEESGKVSPKTLRNHFMVISAVLRSMRPDFRFYVRFPSVVRKEITVPEEEEVEHLLQEASGTTMYIPIALAAYCGMRRGEIAALTEKPTENYIIINKTIVLDEYHKWQIKDHAKTAAGNRRVFIPTDVLNAIREQPFEQVLPNTITDNFLALSARLGYHMRFHDLRHFYASFLMSLNVPDKYIMQRIGHSTDSMLKHYQHSMRAKDNAIDDLVETLVSERYATQMQRKSREAQ